MKTFDPTKPVQLRDGTPARIVSTNLGGDNSRYPIGAIITRDSGDYFDVFAAGGTEDFYSSGGTPSDLVNIPETVTDFINLGDAYSDLSAAKELGNCPVLRLVRDINSHAVISAHIIPPPLPVNDDFDF